MRKAEKSFEKHFQNSLLSQDGMRLIFDLMSQQHRITPWTFSIYHYQDRRTRHFNLHNSLVTPDSRPAGKASSSGDHTNILCLLKAASGRGEAAQEVWSPPWENSQEMFGSASPRAWAGVGEVKVKIKVFERRRGKALPVRARQYQVCICHVITPWVTVLVTVLPLYLVAFFIRLKWLY